MYEYTDKHRGESAAGKSFADCLREDWVKVVKRTTKIWYRDGECRVKLYHDGVYQPGADYFTNDREDAMQTAAKMRGEL